MADDVLCVEGLTKDYGGRRVVDGVDLHVPAGTVFGLLGPNGAGKTTTLRMVLGLARPSSGRMRLLGHELPGGRQAALAGVGAIIEEPRFHPKLTGRENLRAAAALRGAHAWARVEDVLARVSLADRADDRVGTYSLGMRQRLGIARCLLPDPALLVLDEPMNGLDPAGMADLRRMLRDLVAEGRTVIVSTHLLDEVEKACDTVAIIDRGRVVQSGATRALVAGGQTVLLLSTPHLHEASDALRHSGLASAVGPAQDADARPAMAVTLAAGATAAAVVRALVEAGVDVDGLVETRRTLEQHFLAVTAGLPGPQYAGRP